MEGSNVRLSMPDLEGLAPGSFAAGSPVVVAAAPARLDVMGGIADYSGATVLELPLAQRVMVAVQARSDGLMRVQTGGPGAPALERSLAALPVGALFEGDRTSAPERLRAALEDVGVPWAAYLLGPLAILHGHHLLPPMGGLQMGVWSSVPAGAGISSSAALEVAALRAIGTLLDIPLDPLQMAFLSQEAEHRVAASPCGIMDQVTATLGRASHLLVLRCQPAEVMGQRSLPPDLQLAGIHSGVVHQVAGPQYGRVRTATFMGRAMIAAGDRTLPPGGYLCNLEVQRFLTVLAPDLPERMIGRAFLREYGQIDDAVAHVEPDAVYRVRDCTTHPVLEQQNVEAFIGGLDRYERSAEVEGLVQAGEAMYRSHESYGARCGLGTPETDLIVRLVREQGTGQGLYGARITGGGAGGTVAVLGKGEGFRDAVQSITLEYSRRTGREGRVISGSADGAWHTPVRRVMPERPGGLHG